MREFVIKEWRERGPMSVLDDGHHEAASEKAAHRAEPVPAASRRDPAAPGTEPPISDTAPADPAVWTEPSSACVEEAAKSSFIIAYAGEFIGFFEAEGRITPRQAYLRVVQEVAASRPRFDPAALELYKPVLLRSARPAKVDIVRGKLARFSWEPAAAGPADRPSSDVKG